MHNISTGYAAIRKSGVPECRGGVGQFGTAGSHFIESKFNHLFLLIFYLARLLIQPYGNATNQPTVPHRIARPDFTLFEGPYKP
jgi:hypothetical protein